MKVDRYFITEVVIPVAIYALLIFGAFAGAFTTDYYSCKKTSNAMGLNSQWSVWTSCMVQVNGKMVPLDSYRATEDVK